MPTHTKVVQKTRKAQILSLRNQKTVSHQITAQPLMEKIQTELKSGQSYLNLALGVVVVIVVGFLVFNYLKGQQSNLIPAQQKIEQTTQDSKNVTTDNLPGKYTVKEGDTLFKIAESYYKDGWKYSQLVTINKIADENLIEVGQVLEIPQLAETTTATTTDSGQGTGGATNQTIWGETITGDSYTVKEGDWLSTIAGRAYGDIYAFDKIAKANNIVDPNIIEPGTILKLPR